jgi:adenosylcobinamide-phosphate synthase
MTAYSSALIVAALLDLLIGDPRWLPHPVRGMGLLISAIERFLRKLPYEKVSGCILVFAVLFIIVAVVAATLHWGGFLVAVYWIFSCLAVRNLDQESHRVIVTLRNGDLDGARKLVGYLVGRDTKNLSEHDVTRAVFETVAENMNDAVVAPLFYLAIFGVPGMVAYKAVNTMDSMVGYKTERYLRFGWAAARLDDIANYIPARITACLIVLSAAVVKLHWRAAIRAVFRDAHLHPKLHLPVRSVFNSAASITTSDKRCKNLFSASRWKICSGAGFRTSAFFYISWPSAHTSWWRYG